MKMLNKSLLGIVAFLFATASHATLISVSGGTSNLGGSASIIAAPTDVRDDAAYNIAQQGFNERQGYILLSDLVIDGSVIAAGTGVDSHMIFLNTGPGNNGTLASHFNVQWLFETDILGVMSNSSGSYEAASSSFLGAAGTIYPGAFSARGLETNFNNCNMNTNDCYNFSGNLLNLSMYVTEPGDWIRVITAASVPEPATSLLMALGLLGLVVAGKRNLKKTDHYTDLQTPVVEIMPRGHVNLFLQMTFLS